MLDSQVKQDMVMRQYNNKTRPEVDVVHFREVREGGAGTDPEAEFDALVRDRVLG